MGSDEVEGLTVRVHDGRTLGVVVGVFGFVGALIALISMWLVRAHGRSRIEHSPVEKTFQRVRDHALRRLTTSGVLAGLSVTAFTVLLEHPSSSGSQPMWLPKLIDAGFRDVAGITLGIATLGFLAVALSAHRVGRIDELSPDDLDRKREAIKMHEQADGWITWGFLCLGTALLCVAFRIAPPVGIVAVVWTLIMVIFLPTLTLDLLKYMRALTLDLLKYMRELLWPRQPASGPPTAAATQTPTGTANPDHESPTTTLVADRQTAVLALIRTRYTACRAAIPPVWLLAITMLAVMAAWLGRHR